MAASLFFYLRSSLLESMEQSAGIIEPVSPVLENNGSDVSLWSKLDSQFAAVNFAWYFLSRAGRTRFELQELMLADSVEFAS